MLSMYFTLPAPQDCYHVSFAFFMYPIGASGNMWIMVRRTPSAGDSQLSRIVTWLGKVVCTNGLKPLLENSALVQARATKEEETECTSDAFSL